MNLHEKCLLEYLLHPADLLRTVELLKPNNGILVEGKSEESGFLAKNININYTGG